MAFPNTLFPCIGLKTDVSDEEYRLFHWIDRKLVSTLIRSLGRDPFDAINVVGFLLWLERSRLSANAVYKVVKHWSGDKVGMLAEQVLGVFEWLNKPTFVSETCCDVSLISELCKEDVGFVYLYERRVEILERKMDIVNELCDKAFKDFEFGIGGEAVNVPREFEIENCGQGGSGIGGGFVGHPRQLQSKAGVGIGIAAAPAYHPQELRNNNPHAGTEIGGNYFYDPQRLIDSNHTGVEFGTATEFVYGARDFEINSGFAGEREFYNINHNGVGFDFSRRFVHDPRELMRRNYNGNGAGFGVPSGLVRVTREPKNKNVVGYNAGPSHDPHGLQSFNHSGTQAQFGGRFIHDPRELMVVNHNGVGFGNVYGHRDGVRISGGGFPNQGLIPPEVVVGPRMERNMRKSPGYEVGSSSGGGSKTKHPARDPISEQVLSVLLRGLNVTEEETHVHFDDRTVFLTFSKGYPVTEFEVRDFFTRRFGSFIKRIRFEEVEEGVQPIYARMVARNTSILPLICDVEIRTRYIINGKHVWAKKYVRRNSSPPPRLSS
ncbi:hypothetical protein POM88_006221 [Heracleum sosnowskyi]|uniref:Uncharacterized protein n=1 Tax=Heracleum sosnowskyi TaxID=360622 RepID=A0AAD8J4G4_9APIA|nr:hypothetical protein POM88_006221 [Heracleum sosnowskyi]